MGALLLLPPLLMQISVAEEKPGKKRAKGREREEERGVFKDAVPKIVLTSLALPLSKGSPCHLGSPPGGRRREGERERGREIELELSSSCTSSLDLVCVLVPRCLTCDVGRK